MTCSTKNTNILQSVRSNRTMRIESKSILPRLRGSFFLLPFVCVFIIIGQPASANPGEESFSPYEVLSAFEEAYPGVIENIKFTDGDFSVTVRGERFFWAEGRLLPEGERKNWENYNPYPFYRYPNRLPPLPVYSEAEKQRLLARTEEMDTRPVRRHPGFFNALWRINDRKSSWERVKTIYFLGLKTEIHRELLEDLARVEEEILEKAETDPVLAAYVRQIGNLEGYNWRRIAGTSSISFHAYGIALDVIPYSYGGKQVYWRWARTFYPEWFSVPYSIRFIPPESFIEAFEAHGFVWGGKWLFFDNIHFEYRPEILLLNGFEGPF